jgi:hypothetical protein
MDNLTAGQMMPSSEFYDEGTLKADKSKKKKHAKTVESEPPVRIVPTKSVQTILYQSSTGTQTPQRPVAKVNLIKKVILNTKILFTKMKPIDYWNIRC